MAMAVHAAQMNSRKGIMVFIVLTMVLGTVFLGIKGIEYSHKFHEHLIPGLHFEYAAEPQFVRHAQIFFSLYFVMTGLHAAAHDRRHGPDDVDAHLDAPGASSATATTLPSRSWACTGTSSTSCGFSSFRCCI